MPAPEGSFREAVRVQIKSGKEALDALHQAKAYTSSLEFTTHFPVKDVMGYKRGELNLFEWCLAQQMHNRSGESSDSTIKSQTDEIIRSEITRRELQIQKKAGGTQKTAEIKSLADRFGELYAQYSEKFGSIDPKKAPLYTTDEATKARIAMGNELKRLSYELQNPNASEGPIKDPDKSMREFAGEPAPERERTHNLEAQIGGYRDQIALLGPTADGGVWRDKVMNKIIEEELSEELNKLIAEIREEPGDEIAKLIPDVAEELKLGLSDDKVRQEVIKRIAYKRLKQKYFFDPVINMKRTGKDWQASDAINEANNIMDDAVSTLYFDGKVDKKFSGVGSLAEGVGTVAATTIMRGKKLVVFIAPSDESTDAFIKNAREQARKDLELMAQTTPDNIIIATSFEELAVKTWQARRDMLEVQREHPQKERVPLRVGRRTATIEYKNHQTEQLSLENLICISGSSRPDALVHNQLIKYWDEHGLPVKDMRRTDFTLDIYGNEEVPQKFVSLLNVVTVEPTIMPDGSRIYRSYGAIKDLGNAIQRVVAVDPPTYTILYMPEDTSGLSDNKDYVRARNLIQAQYDKLCAEFPELAHYIRIINDVSEIERQSTEIMEQIPREQWTEITETPDTAGGPENFHKDEHGRPGYYPDRIVTKTPRLALLREVVGQAAQDVPEAEHANVEKRLSDLLRYNAYANIFPPMHVAGDGIGVPDESEYAAEIAEAIKKGDFAEGTNFDNTITLIVRQDPEGKLLIGPAGGFVAIDEGPNQVVSRRFRQKTGGVVGKAAIIGLEDDPGRDDRFAVVSTIAGLTTNPVGLQPGPNTKTEKVITVKLVNDDGTLNTSYFEAGTYTDATGQEFTHNGFFAGHEQTIRMMYDYYLKYGYDDQGNRLTLSQTIKKMSQFSPQAEFQEAISVPSFDVQYRQIEWQGQKLRLTPNIEFTLSQAWKVFREAGLEPQVANARAIEFVMDAVSRKVEIGGSKLEAELLPEFPLPAVTVDCLIVTGEKRDRLLVEQAEDGKFYLPGTFYSKEQTDKGASSRQTAIDVVADKFGATFIPEDYVGSVGGEVILDYQTDPRYPRKSFVYVGRIDGEYKPNPERLRPGSKLVEIPIYNEEGGLSDQLMFTYWGFDHGFEIVHPHLLRALGLLRQNEMRGGLVKENEQAREQVLFGPYSRQEFTDSYPDGTYVDMVDRTWAPQDLKERERMWINRERFWHLMEGIRADGRLGTTDITDLPVLLEETMRTVLAEVQSPEIGPFEKNITPHIATTGRTLEQLIEGDTEGRFLTKRNAQLLTFVGSIHDLFNGLSLRDGQVMLDHQFILENFMRDFFKEGQVITIGREQVTLTKEDSIFMHAVARHENIFDEDAWESLAEGEGNDLETQIAHAKSLILVADILGDAITFDGTNLNLDSSKLPSRLGDLMRRHLAHEDMADGKIFRPKWLLTAKTLATTFQALEALFGIRLIDMEDGANPNKKFVQAALKAITDARVNDSERNEASRYTKDELTQLAQVQQLLVS